jgi:hypothetical protein
MSSTVSRRDFLAATAATGLALGMVPGADAAPQQAADATPEDASPVRGSAMYSGTAAGAVLAQLKAAGVRTLFHTNTSGFVPFWEAIYAAGDVQVINMTHEGQAVAAAAGYTMASRNLGFFFGSHVGIFNSLSNTYNAWKDRVPMRVTFSGGGTAEQGQDSFESWDNTLGPTEPFTRWTGALGPDDVTGTLRRAMKFAFGPPSGPVTLMFGAGGEKVNVSIYPIDLATMRARSRAPADAIETAARWLVEGPSTRCSWSVLRWRRGRVRRDRRAGREAVRSRCGDDAQPLREFPERPSAVSGRAAGAALSAEAGPVNQFWRKLHRRQGRLRGLTASGRDAPCISATIRRRLDDRSPRT